VATPNYTQMTLRHLRSEGKLVAVVEKYVQIPGAKFGFRKDLFGIIDIIALDPTHGIVGIQSTSGKQYPKHYKEMTDSDEVYKDTGLSKPEACLAWIQAGGRLELHGWRKLLVKRGGKAKRWVPKVHVFSEGDFE